MTHGQRRMHLLLWLTLAPLVLSGLLLALLLRPAEPVHDGALPGVTTPDDARPAGRNEAEQGASS